MSYIMHFGLEGKFSLPKDFFVPSIADDTFENPYGFKVRILPKGKSVESLMWELHSEFFFDPETNTGYFCLLNTSENVVVFDFVDEKFVARKLEYSFEDNGGSVINFIIRLIQTCKLSLMVMDRGDEEFGYVEDECTRELIHRVFTDGVLTETITE